MTKREMITELNKLGLVLIVNHEDNWAIGVSRFANVMMGFNPRTTVENYSGGVNFKIINANLFTGEEIKGASRIVHDFLMTPLSKREVN